MKLGRNDQCHCGSGRKYKKCCEEHDKADERAARRRPPPERDAKGLLIGRPFIDTQWPAQEKRVRAIGNTVAFRPPHETNYEFFLSVLCDTYGKEWHEAQMELAAQERHVIHRWIEASDAVRMGKGAVPVTKEDEHLYSAPMTGELKALSCLAYDIYTVHHGGPLPASQIKRLKRADQFQGARYEVAVAAVFIRAGYELEWLTATDRKLPEFIARQPVTKSEIVVEAKSRHRPGVLGRAGEAPDLDEITVDVGGLFSRALEKETNGRPYAICLDLNVPTAQSGDQAQWISEINRMVKPQGFETTGELDPFSAIFIANYSWHWDGQDPAGNPMNFTVQPLRARVPLPVDEGRLLAEALFQYGNVPEEGEAEAA